MHQWGSRFGALLAIGALLTGCVADSARTGQSASVASVAKAPRPNVIVIIADDLGYADISAFGIKRINTPNIDRIGGEGAKFPVAYATAPVCSPSRAGVQTGRYQERFGFEFNNGPAERDVRQNLGLPAGEITIADALRKQGYHTGIVGKWHLGSNDDFYPTKRGYDEFVGILTGQTNYIDAAAPGVHVAHFDVGVTKRGRGAPNEVFEGPNRTVVNNYNEYLTDYFARRATEYISRNARSDNPYFLYMAFNAPHAPLQVTQKYYDRFPQIKDETARIYAAMISALDDAVGEILTAVEASGEADNTIIYFLSDNGCAAYQPGVCSCEPLRGGKLTHYEGGVRVPLMMRWPAKVKPGTVYRNPVSTMDIFPTVVAAAGGSLPADRPYDGVDIMPYLTGKNTGQPHDILAWRRQPLVSIRKGDWKLWKSVDSGEYGTYTLLFNLKDDPNENKNLAEQNPEKVKELEEAIKQWAKDLKDPLWPTKNSVQYDVCGTPFVVPV
ncbi:sulfatase-like hydrolase/transferase [Phenylobacterium sp.]|uniref:sulfatase-like hydrolase/transferase n=1 Tax=Phenylobacterium sp. TaxID=1871053 RepID=UPI0025F4667D|nr:sulfatase-like hydrolase/transferase [Phenylobacterium sp.]MBX3485116.1 sulfatase-like hydrolase/transferase [Phenylobacterium sp.]